MTDLGEFGRVNLALMSPVAALVSANCHIAISRWSATACDAVVHDLAPSFVAFNDFASVRIRAEGALFNIYLGDGLYSVGRCS